MNKMYMAYANLTDGENRWRVNVLKDEDRSACLDALEAFKAACSTGTIKVESCGVHDFYIIPRSDWEKLGKDYKGSSIRHPGCMTVMEGSIPGNHGKGGTTLLFEGYHFEIA